MKEITIPLTLIKDYDDNAQVKGFYENKSITIYLSDITLLNLTIYKAPCMVFREYDSEGSEKLGTIITKDTFIIDLTEEQAKFFKDMQ